LFEQDTISDFVLGYFQALFTAVAIECLERDSKPFTGLFAAEKCGRLFAAFHGGNEFFYSTGVKFQHTLESQKKFVGVQHNNLCEESGVFKGVHYVWEKDVVNPAKR
jgi:hypothetical protein